MDNTGPTAGSAREPGRDQPPAGSRGAAAKRFLGLGLLAAAGAGGLAGVTDVRHLPAALVASSEAAGRAAELAAQADRRAAELAARADLRESQRAATAWLVDRLADGRMTLAEVTDVLADNAREQPAFLAQLADSRNEPTERGRLAGFALDRARERLGDHPSLLADLNARVAAEGN